MTLAKASQGSKLTVRALSGNEKVNRFLFSLGCGEGEEITLVSILAGNYVVNIKDSRYAIDRKMAQYIEVA